MRPQKSPRHRHLSWRLHSLSIFSIGLLVFWIVAYAYADPRTHLGSFFGNAIADWSGSVTIILGTKFLVEAGSAESRPVYGHKKGAVRNFLWRHSLLLFLLVTWILWLVFYLRTDPESKWGQVVGNIVSEWVQMAGLVFLTKSLVEHGSKESR